MNPVSVVRPDRSVYPLLLIPDRFEGAFSGGAWHAWPVAKTERVPDGIYASRSASEQFWAVREAAGVPMVGTGSTPAQATGDLRVSLRREGRGLPDPTDPEEIAGLRPYLVDSGMTIAAAKRVLQCATGLGGEDYGDLIDALEEAEAAAKEASKNVRAGADLHSL
jgi:hypothetical protein